MISIVGLLVIMIESKCLIIPVSGLPCQSNANAAIKNALFLLYEANICEYPLSTSFNNTLNRNYMYSILANAFEDINSKY